VTRRLPDFIVAGVRKCGTTWLDQCLREHPGIYLPTQTKEVFYFDRYFSRGNDWYGAYFADAGERQIVGEVSPTYFVSPDAPDRILATVPAAKLVFVFREPVARVVSLYHHLRAKGDTALSLSDAVEELPELLEEGFYARHLAHYRAVFPHGNLMPLLVDDLQAGAGGTQSLFRFLGVDPGFAPPSQGGRAYGRREARSHALARVAAGTSRLLHAAGLHGAVKFAKSLGAEKVVMRDKAGAAEPLDPAIAARLYALYDDDIKRLGDMMGRDLREVWNLDAAMAGSGTRE
jgi:hypothetical protein